MISDALRQRTISEWRELGFYYEQAASTWRLLGSPTGLQEFVRLLREFAFDERHWTPPAHRHYGPYEYLTVSVAAEPRIDERGIAGTPQDLDVLACHVEAALEVFGPGEAVDLGRDYAGAGNWALRLEIQVDGFDPAAADPLLASSAGAE